MRVTAFIVLSAVVFAWFGGALAQTNLPVHVQADLLRVRIDDALTRGRADEALALLDELTVLQPEAANGDLALLEARTAVAAGDFSRAEAVLARMLSVAERGSDSYNAALALLASLEQQRNTRLSALLRDARRADTLGQFDLVEETLTRILNQAQQGDPVYGEALRLLAQVPERRAQLAAAQETAARMALEAQAAAREQNLAAQGRQALLDAERDIYLSADPQAVLHLRWILNSRYGVRSWEAPEPSPYLTEAERPLLAQFRRDSGATAGLRVEELGYLDRDILLAAAGIAFEPRRPDFSAADRAERSGDWISTTLGDDPTAGDFECDALTVATAMRPLPEYGYPVIRLSARREGSDGDIRFRRPVFDIASEIDLRIDGRQIAATNSDGAVSVTRFSEFMQGLRAGQVMTLRGVSATTNRMVTYEFSLRGFTRSFQRMAQLCSRPDLLNWIR